MKGRRDANNSRMERKCTGFNCGSESHLEKRYPNSVNFSKKATSRVYPLRGTQTRSAVHIILAHLCSELDERISVQDVGDDSDNEDAAILVSVLVRDAQNSVTERKNACGDNKHEIFETFQVQIKVEPTTGEIWGVCIDSGALCTAIGQIQLEGHAAKWEAT